MTSKQKLHKKRGPEDSIIDDNNFRKRKKEDTEGIILITL